jgi:hypothetical protein
MALTINGTTGISGVDGSASAPSIVGSDTNTGFSFASDTVNINTGGSLRAQVDSNGRLSIGGQTSVSTLLHVENSSGDAFVRCRASTNRGLLLTDSSSGDLRGFVGNGGAVNLPASSMCLSAPNGPIVFQRGGTASGNEIARFSSSGALHIGNTSAISGETGLTVRNNGEAKVSYFRHDHSSQRSCIDCQNGHATGGQSAIMIEFRRSDGNSVGGIFASTSNVQYNTASDYRLKENQVLISDGITRLKTLKPYRFNWKDNKDRIVDGFFAHEVTAVPEAVSGTKDGTMTYKNVVLSDQNVVLAEGIPEADYIAAQKLTPPTYDANSTWKASYTCEDYQGVDQSKLVPLLTAALQEAVGKIETLETKVAALEAA